MSFASVVFFAMGLSICLKTVNPAGVGLMHRPYDVISDFSNRVLDENINPFHKMPCL